MDSSDPFDSFGESSIYVRLPNGHMIVVKRKYGPQGLKLRGAWEPVEVELQVFAMMPGDDNTPKLGNVTLGMFGIPPPTLS